MGRDTLRSNWYKVTTIGTELTPNRPDLSRPVEITLGLFLFKEHAELFRDHLNGYYGEVKISRNNA